METQTCLPVVPYSVKHRHAKSLGAVHVLAKHQCLYNKHLWLHVCRACRSLQARTDVTGSECTHHLSGSIKSVCASRV